MPHLLSAGVAPGQVAVHTVGGPSHHLATDVFELLDAVAESNDLRGANECEVHRPGKEYLRGMCVTSTRCLFSWRACTGMGCKSSLDPGTEHLRALRPLCSRGSGRTRCRKYPHQVTALHKDTRPLRARCCERHGDKCICDVSGRRPMLNCRRPAALCRCSCRWHCSHLYMLRRSAAAASHLEVSK